MTTSTYNGWKNYATWGVALVIDNDQSAYETVLETVARIRSVDAPMHPNVPKIWTVEEAARFELADWLKDFTEELCGLEGEDLGIPEPSLMARQILQAGLSDVDWDEIADNYLAE